MRRAAEGAVYAPRGAVEAPPVLQLGDDRLRQPSAPCDFSDPELLLGFSLSGSSAAARAARARVKRCRRYASAAVKSAPRGPDLGAS